MFCLVSNSLICTQTNQLSFKPCVMLSPGRQVATQTAAHICSHQIHMALGHTIKSQQTEPVLLQVCDFIHGQYHVWPNSRLALDILHTWFSTAHPHSWNVFCHSLSNSSGWKDLASWLWCYLCLKCGNLLFNHFGNGSAGMISIWL